MITLIGGAGQSSLQEFSSGQAYMQGNVKIFAPDVQTAGHPAI
jgi:hypothetical protein